MTGALALAGPGRARAVAAGGKFKLNSESGTGDSGVGIGAFKLNFKLKAPGLSSLAGCHCGTASAVAVPQAHWPQAVPVSHDSDFESAESNSVTRMMPVGSDYY
jgi:hypothetical protein